MLRESPCSTRLRSSPPVECAGCGADDRAVCGRVQEPSSSRPSPRVPLDDLVVYTAPRYEAVTRRILLALWEQKSHHTARVFDEAMGAAVDRAAFTTHQRTRSPFPPAAAPGARAATPRPPAAARSPSPRVPGAHGHRHRHPPEDPHGDERAINRTNTFVGTPSSRRPKWFVIIDDVLTTGATMREAHATPSRRRRGRGRRRPRIDAEVLRRKTVTSPGPRTRGRPKRRRK